MKLMLRQLIKLRIAVNPQQQVIDPHCDQDTAANSTLRSSGLAQLSSCSNKVKRTLTWRLNTVKWCPLISMRETSAKILLESPDLLDLIMPPQFQDLSISSRQWLRSLTKKASNQVSQILLRNREKSDRLLLKETHAIWAIQVLSRHHFTALKSSCYQTI